MNPHEMKLKVCYIKEIVKYLAQSTSISKFPNCISFSTAFNFVRTRTSVLDDFT